MTHVHCVSVHIKKVIALLVNLHLLNFHLCSYIPDAVFLNVTYVKGAMQKCQTQQKLYFVCTSLAHCKHNY